MTAKQGRLGRKFNRSGMADPRGTWAAGAPASAGFQPEQGVRFSGTNDPLSCPPAAPCSSTDESGAGRQFASTGLKLSNGASKTRPKSKRRGLRARSRR